MAIYFLDSSALVKRYRYETGSERVSTLMDSGEPLMASRLAQVEVAAAIVRRGRVAAVLADDVDRTLAVFGRHLLSSFDLVEIDAIILESAVALTRKHALRGADAVQLACALLARADAGGREVIMVGSDQELNAAAVAEGLAVVDPTKA